MKSLKGIASFVSVAASGSFAAAAKLQGVTAVAVSKNVATLERQLCVRLFQRTTRSLKLTPEGQTFYDQCAGPLRELEAAEAMTAHSMQAAEGLVRVTCVPPIATGFLLPLLGKFYALHPKVQVEVNLDIVVADMVSEGFDVGIRVGPLNDSNWIARPIAPLPFVLCASLAYLAKMGAPQTLEDLVHHNCIRVTRPGRQGFMPWALKGMCEEVDKQIKGNVIVSDFGAAVQTAASGLGLVCAPLPLAMPLFRSGELRPVLTALIVPRLEVYLHYPNRKNLPNRTRVFVDFVLDELRHEPDLQTDAQLLVAPFVGVAAVELV
jgi:DNA-binding transcriptional LysR family regulator